MEEANETGGGRERRRYERVEKDLAVRYCRLERFGSGALDGLGELLDIGGGGLCFLAEESIELGAQLVLMLEFPGWLADGDHWIATKNDDDVGTLHVIGMVVWVAVSRKNPAAYDIGVQFSGIVRK
ncbi:MAG TPA: PilZ domain-containing protein [Desulfurivibrionaceae bacterium]|nr:PilZ domain-containing protein [Desulfurivibrionaceae bacterium]